MRGRRRGGRPARAEADGGGGPAGNWRRVTTFLTAALLAAGLLAGGCDAPEGGAVGGNPDTASGAPSGSASGQEAPAPGDPASDQEADTAGEAERGDGDASTGSDGLVALEVGGVPVRVEVADTPDERRRGLMHRDSLPADQGMLFVYPEEQTLSFWMRDTGLPLDIAFIDRRGVIVDIQQMEPYTEELYRSRSPALYALEMNRGWFEAHGVEVGDRVRF